MQVGRETLIEIAASVLVVGGFIASVLFVGDQYGNGGLSETGAIALVGLMVAFIVVMSAVGYWLSTREG